MESRTELLQKEIDVLREKLNFAEAILDKAPCLLYINEIGRINESTILKLTRREREVLKLLTKGECAKKISSRLKISESTVISHRKNMLKKLKLNNTASLVNFAVENGLN